MTAAVDAGATVATHLFNGMRGLHHRDPGPVGALLSDARVTCEIVNDGEHVNPLVVGLAARAAASGQVALITDAVAATGAPDGEYLLGPQRVVHVGGAVRLPAGDPNAGSLGGGNGTLVENLRRAVTVVGLSLVDAVSATTSVPAAALGVADRFGSLAAGRAADLCVLDADLRLAGVLKDGRWAVSPAAQPDPGAV